MDRSLTFGLGVLALAVLPTPAVIAAEYLTVEGAQKAVFPEADGFRQVLLSVGAEQRQAITQRAGMQPLHGALRLFKAMRGEELVGYLFIDEVIGRQDLITYALGIDAGGVLRTPEILAYRESHGGEVRARGWRQQFANRRGVEQLAFRTDIKNIAGATLSSEHLTQGVRWLVATWEVALRSGNVAASAP
jgi:hypothetical protein